MNVRRFLALCVAAVVYAAPTSAQVVQPLKASEFRMNDAGMVVMTPLLIDRYLLAAHGRDVAGGDYWRSGGFQTQRDFALVEERVIGFLNGAPVFSPEELAALSKRTSDMRAARGKMWSAVNFPKPETGDGSSGEIPPETAAGRFEGWVRVTLIQGGRATVVNRRAADDEVERRDLHGNEWIGVGAEISVPHNTWVEIELPNGGKLEIGPNTVFRVEDLSTRPRFRVEKGKVTAKVKKPLPSINQVLNGLEIWTGTSVTISDHTEFTVSFDPQTRVSITTVGEGSVTVRNLATGATVTVSQGQRVDVTERQLGEVRRNDPSPGPGSSPIAIPVQASSGNQNSNSVAWSADGKNLGAGASRYEGISPVTAMIAYDGGVLTAFSNVAGNANLYAVTWSADGYRLGDGSVVYQGCSPVTSMIPYRGGVLTSFSNSGCNPDAHVVMWSANGKNLGQGELVYQGCSPVTAMKEFGGGVLVAFSNVACDPNRHAILWSPDGKNVGRGRSEYEGCSPVTAMEAYGSGMLVAFSNVACDPKRHRIHWSPDGRNLGAGAMAYEGCSPVTAITLYKPGLLTAFTNVRCAANANAIVWSPDRNGLGTGPTQYDGNARVTAIVAYKGGVLTAFSGGRPARPDGASSQVPAPTAKSRLGGLFGRIRSEAVAAGILSAAVPAASSGMLGAWYTDGNRSAVDYIRDEAGSIVFINQFGGRARGRIVSSSLVIADEWEGGLRGTVSPDGRRISWANGTSWQRMEDYAGPIDDIVLPRPNLPPGTAGFLGTWYTDGNQGAVDYIREEAGGVVFINHFGGRARGRIISSSLVIADEWEGGLRGTVSPDGRRISWANGTFWTR